MAVGDAGVAVHEVDAAEVLADAGEHRVDCALVAQIGPIADGAAALPHHRVHGGFGVEEVHDGDVGARPRQQFGGGGADAARATGHDRDPAPQREQFLDAHVRPTLLARLAVSSSAASR